MSLVVFVDGQRVGLCNQSPYAPGLWVDAISSVRHGPVVKRWIRPCQITDLLDVLEVVVPRTETPEDGYHVFPSNEYVSVAQICCS